MRAARRCALPAHDGCGFFSRLVSAPRSVTMIRMRASLYMYIFFTTVVAAFAALKI